MSSKRLSPILFLDPILKHLILQNDWKRHENSQHFQPELFKCHEHTSLGTNSPLCGDVFYDAEFMEDHLKHVHNIEPSTTLKAKVNQNLIGRHHQVRFWCGFCLSNISLDNHGVQGWDERFNHIDGHFKSGWTTLDWVDAETKKRKKDMEGDFGAKDKGRDDGPTRSGYEALETNGIDAIDAIASAGSKRRREDSHEDPTEPGGDKSVCCVSFIASYYADDVLTCVLLVPKCNCGGGPYNRAHADKCNLYGACGHLLCPNCAVDAGPEEAGPEEASPEEASRENAGSPSKKQRGRFVLL
jgi:hypothetical protein